MTEEVCANCETPTLVEHTDKRQELGRDLPYKYHACSACGTKQVTFEDMKWNAGKMREFYGEREGEIKRGLTLEQKYAYMKAWLWCFWAWLRALVEIPEWPRRPQITVNVEEKVLAITAVDDEHRIYKTFWPKGKK